MWSYATKHKFQVIVWILIAIYILYFSIFTVLRSRHIYAHYFDLGIMHQTVYNTYQALKTGDLSRVLELTSPHGGGAQIKRMAIHNDIILALLAPFYFIYAGPETLLVLQTVVLAAGAWAVFLIAKKVLKNELIGVVLSFAYLMYSPMQRANIFEFHAVTFATTFILYMFYFWLQGRTRLSFLFLVLTLLTKEEVGLSLGMFGIYVLYEWLFKRHPSGAKKTLQFPILVTLVSWGWVLASMLLIIPTFSEGSGHFAAGYYDGVVGNAFGYVFHKDTFHYFRFLLGPIGFLTLVAPEFLVIAGPELAINLLSSNWNLRSVFFQYTSAIQPWVFIGAIYGAQRLLSYTIKLKKYKFKVTITTIVVLILAGTAFFSYHKSPLPYSRERDLDPILYDRAGEYEVITYWQEQLKDDDLKVSSSGQIGPFFTSRRYFYNFSDDYQLADYVIISLPDVQYGFQNEITKPAYEHLKKDSHFQKIYEQNGYEVYKKVYSGT